jgi:hypothetical protein
LLVNVRLGQRTTCNARIEFEADLGRVFGAHEQPAN